MAEVVDATPKWEDMLPVMMQVIEFGDNEEAKTDLRGELARMARLADERNNLVKEGFPPAAVRVLGNDDLAFMVESLRGRAEFMRAQHDNEDAGRAWDALATMVEG